MKTSLITLILFFLSSCGPRLVKINHDASRQLKTTTVQTLAYPPPVLAAMSAKKAFLGGLFGAVGGGIAGASMYQDGKELMRDGHLSDPALEVQEKFLNTLRSEGTMVDFQKVDSPEKKGDLKRLARQFNQGMLFDFKTLGWGYVYYPVDWTHYRVIYALRARLIKFPEAKVLWQAKCSIKGDDTSDQRPTLDSLLVNNGAILKSRLSMAAVRCNEQLLQAFKTDPVSEQVPHQASVIEESKKAPEPSQQATSDSQPVSNEPEVPSGTLSKSLTAEKPKQEEPMVKQESGSKAGEGAASTVTGGTCQVAPESLVKLYPMERCEVAILVKRCGPKDECMIDCYIMRKGEGKLGGCYDVCDVYRNGWSIPKEWASCR